MEYKLPDKLKLQNEYLKRYGEEFLLLNDLKVGDEVILDFNYQSIHTKYNSRELERFNNYKKAKGILKLDENGCLFAESIDDADFYVSKSNGFCGRSRRTWYQLERKKSIYKFGVGFIL